MPALALFAMLIPVMGLGSQPAIAALVLYSLLILVRNVATGLRDVPAEVIDAADGMGFGRARRLLRIELPLAMPVIVAGIRIAVVTQIAVATVAAYINAGGLGDIIFQASPRISPRRSSPARSLTSLLAVVADETSRLLERRLRPPDGAHRCWLKRCDLARRDQRGSSSATLPPPRAVAAALAVGDRRGAAARHRPERAPGGAGFVNGIANVLRTIPSLALLVADAAAARDRVPSGDGGADRLRRSGDPPQHLRRDRARSTPTSSTPARAGPTRIARSSGASKSRSPCR